jgi:hypothetical protein
MTSLSIHDWEELYKTAKDVKEISHLSLFHEPIEQLDSHIRTWIEPILQSNGLSPHIKWSMYHSAFELCIQLLLIRRQLRVNEAVRLCKFGYRAEHLWKDVQEDDLYIKQFTSVYGVVFE